MNQFGYERAATVADAVRAVAGRPGAKFIGGGTNLIDLMKENVARPTHLVDVTRLPLDQVQALPDGGLRIGATVANSDLAWHPRIEADYPMLSRALLSGASPQLRNKATTGGNLLQRTRCYYFYDTGTACNKREPGTGCPAITGVNRIHAILGTSDHCIATHPSDMCVALAALEAVIHVVGPGGERRIPMGDFHRLPGDRPDIDTHLAAEELILAVELPPPRFAAHSTYLKLRDRASYAFALVSVAAGLELENGVIRDGRIAMGGVAHKPWRVPEAEQLLVGQAPGVAVFERVADRLLDGAVGRGQNDFKIELGRRAVVRALRLAASAPVPAAPAPA